MATLFDYYVINLFINGREVEASTSEYSFVLSDSIYEFYPTASITVHDVIGIYQEYLVFAEGDKFTIEYGDKDNTSKSDYIVRNSHLPEAENPGKLNGYIDVPLIHNYFNEQEVISKGYKDRISGIVRNLAGKYNFESVDIDDTGNEDYWLQTLQTDANFIKNTLLPNAFSRNANRTPFYCYITTDNVFHLRNYQSILDEGNAATIEYKQHGGDTKKGPTFKGISQNIRKWSDDIKEHWTLRARDLFKIDRNDGTLIEEEDTLKEYPTKNPWNPPILNDNGNKTGYKNFLFNESTTGRQENISGQKTNSMQESMFLEHFLVIVPLDPTLHSGRTIQLNIYDPDGSKYSKNYSGRYIIEDCEHVWNGKTSNAFTKLIVGRKYLQVSDNYILKGALM